MLQKKRIKIRYSPSPLKVVLKSSHLQVCVNDCWIRRQSENRNLGRASSFNLVTKTLHFYENIPPHLISWIKTQSDPLLTRVIFALPFWIQELLTLMQRKTYSPYSLCGSNINLLGSFFTICVTWWLHWCK